MKICFYFSHRDGVETFQLMTSQPWNSAARGHGNKQQYPTNLTQANNWLASFPFRIFRCLNSFCKSAAVALQKL